MPLNINVEELLDNMEQSLRQYLSEHGIEQPMMVGIHTGGVWLAERLHQRLGLEKPMGVLDISFYRDDFTRVGLNPKVKPSSVPLSTEDQHLILVDDVVMTGRTIRAALNELFDYGRPASVTLMALLDLNARELPIRPDIIGQTLSLEKGQQIKLLGPDPLSLELQQKSD
ncbi:MAG: bifunctional pyr operon transcriptional regulator/uracil phosphoribosyltransferase PyrR [Motiliproteus sp.]|nr:bifunctional pyr operon transcriptional regulator/uracil phosphoribosyltransferase PyrR [Motiliproteus sp.]